MTSFLGVSDRPELAPMPTWGRFFDYLKNDNQNSVQEGINNDYLADVRGK